MSEQNDKPLHDWVRQSLHQYQPPYDPRDWERMQRALQHRRWWRTGLISFACLLVGGILGWWVLAGGNTEPPKNSLAVTTPKPSLLVHDSLSLSPVQPSTVFTTPNLEAPSIPRKRVTSVSYLKRENMFTSGLAQLESRRDVSELKMNPAEPLNQTFG